MAFSSGCTALVIGGAAAIGGAYFYKGEIKASYPVSIQHLYDVTLYTFQEDGIKVISVKNTKYNADIVGKLNNGDEIKVHINYNDESLATYGIRIGYIGDEQRSRNMLLRFEQYI